MLVFLLVAGHSRDVDMRIFPSSTPNMNGYALHTEGLSVCFLQSFCLMS